MEKLRMVLREAINSLRANKVRSTLTMSGIIIGIAAVILMVSIGRGARDLLIAQVEELGSNVVFVLAGGDGGQRRGPPAAARGIVTKTLVEEDLNDLKNAETQIGLQYVTGFTSTYPVTIKVGKEDDVVISVKGRDRNFFFLQDPEFEEGRFWTDREESANKRVAVLGGSAKERIFGSSAGSVLGERVKIRGENYEIIGVLTQKDAGIGGIIGQSEDQNIVIPLEVMQKHVLGVDYLAGIAMDAKDKSNEATELVIDQVERLLRDNHDLRDDEENDFSVRAQKDAIEIFTIITDVFTVFLAAIASISLLVGGIGIMNIMFVSVTERTFEIGLRKALGAQKRDILWQFIAESILLTIVGGTIGITLGLAGAYAIAWVAGWTFIIEWMAIVLATMVSSAFGLVFGVYPAYKASQLDPIMALRYE